MKTKFNLSIFFIVAVLFVAFTIRQSLIQPPKVDSTHAFNTERAFERLERILGDESPHPVDSDANDAVRERLISEIEAIGFTPIVTDRFYCNQRNRALLCARVQNVMFWIGNAGLNAIMVASHYDSVPTGPGAADDGSGVAASLEIAYNLKLRDLARPVLVMITDGEEVGLVGAASFVENDPFAKLITAVVSMEARGNSGPVALIETSSPNGRDLAVLKTDIQKPIASSLATDVYAAMPNSTDVTEYLKLGLDASNFALGGGAQFYHTPQDSLARLDQRSFFHMGATALRSVEALLEKPGDEPEQQWMYIDLFGLLVLKLPQLLGLPLIVLGGLLAISVFTRNGKGGIVKALAFPPLAILLGVGFAIGVTMLIGALRQETYFAAAQPWALRGAQNAAALMGAGLALILLGRNVPKPRLIMTGWIWFALLGFGATFFFPGAAILFAPALAIIALAGLLFKSQSRAAYTLITAAAILFTLMGITTSALGEVMLFPEYAAPFALFLVLAFIVLVPLFIPDERVIKSSRIVVPLAGLGITATFVITALLVTAYSSDAPRGLSVMHSQNEAGKARWSIRGSDPLPESMSDIAKFEAGTLTGYSGKRFIAEAPSFATSGLSVNILRNEVIGKKRVVILEIEAADTDVLDIGLSGDSLLVSSVSVNGLMHEEAPPKRVRCTGRSCRTVVYEAKINATAQDVSIALFSYRYGLGSQSQALLDARPDWALPQHRGDIRAIKEVIEITPLD
ncbi:MAG: hypothetical protein ACJAVV_000198 [Alphaproteobacteria bacterium]|jgi:hypothetical protein